MGSEVRSEMEVPPNSLFVLKERGSPTTTTWAPFSKCLNLGKNFWSCGKWTYNNGDLEWPLSNIRTCLMNPYYKLYVYFLGPKILTEIETLKAKLEKGAMTISDDICRL